MNFRTTTVSLRSGTAILIALSSIYCSSEKSPKTPCEKQYRMAKKCLENTSSRSEFLQRCKATSRKRLTASKLKCSRHTDCGQFRHCLGAASVRDHLRDRRKRNQERFRRFREKKDYEKLSSLCRHNFNDLLAHQEEYCTRTLPRKHFDRLHELVLALMYKGQWTAMEDAFQKIKDALIHLNKRSVRHRMRQRVQRLGKLVFLAGRVEQVEVSVAKTIKKNDPSLPLGCGCPNFESYDRIRHPAAARLKGRFLDICYRTLGRFQLQHMLSNPKPDNVWCYFYLAIKKHGLRGPTLDALMKRAKPLCEAKKK